MTDFTDDERELIETANEFRKQVPSTVNPGSLIGLWLRTASALEARIAETKPEPQGEPSDAQVDAALARINLYGFNISPTVMRAALRAARGVR